MHTEQIQNKRRRVRIISKPDEYKGWQLRVFDADTQEEIQHVYRIEITLDARELNVARVFTYAVNENGAHFIDAETGDLAKDSYTSQRPEYDIYAELVEE